MIICCNIQLYMLYVINNTVPFYMLSMIIYTALHKDIVFMRRYITKLFLVAIARIHCLMF